MSKDSLRSALCFHSNETRAHIANLPNSAQLEGTIYHFPKLHPGLCSSMGMRRGTDRQTDGRDHYTFCVVFDLAKCKCMHFYPTIRS